MLTQKHFIEKGDIQLSPHFRLSEFINGGETPRLVPTDQQIQTCYIMAWWLEGYRAVWQKPIIILSGIRSKEYNKKVGGARHSRHLYENGLGAVDIKVKGMAHKDVQKWLHTAPGGVGSYNKHTHLDNGPYARWQGTSR